MNSIATIPRHLSPRDIAEHAQRHRSEELPFDADVAVDFTKPFLCPTLTPFYYTSTWSELCDADRLRYTQLSALSFNELFAWIENGFTATLLALSDCDLVPADLRDLFPGFIEDERRHQRMWWTLNRLADPARYESDRPSITRIAPAARTLMGFVARRPVQFPVAIWLMLTLEEHANEISRRCAQRRPDMIEPHFAAAYLAHVRDEARHVQIDWHLLDALWPRMTQYRRNINTWIFAQVVRRLLLRTEHAVVSVVKALLDERPALRPLMPRIRRELREVGRHPDYRTMMFSTESSPIAFHLMDRFPKLREALS